MIPETLGALVSDAASYGGVTTASLAGSAITTALQKMLQSRAERAREILLEELGQGEKKAWEIALEDESLAILYRYHTAALNGSARLNLRLMAKIINGMTCSPYFNAQDFLSYSDLISPLRQDEIILIATLHKICQIPPSQDFGGIMEKLKDELVPRVFESQDLLLAVCAGVVRTGLVQAVPAGLDGITFYTTSALMAHLEHLASFEEAVRQEVR